LKVSLDISQIDDVLEEEIETSEIKNRYELLKKYCEAFEKTFLRKGFFTAPYILYEQSIADEYFFDYVVQTKNDLDRLIASSFNFPV